METENKSPATDYKVQADEFAREIIRISGGLRAARPFCYSLAPRRPLFSPANSENTRKRGRKVSETVTAAHTVCTAMTGSDA